MLYAAFVDCGSNWHTNTSYTCHYRIISTVVHCVLLLFAFVSLFASSFTWYFMCCAIFHGIAYRMLTHKNITRCRTVYWIRQRSLLLCFFNGLASSSVSLLTVFLFIKVFHCSAVTKFLDVSFRRTMNRRWRGKKMRSHSNCIIFHHIYYRSTQWTWFSKRTVAAERWGRDIWQNVDL